MVLRCGFGVVSRSAGTTTAQLTDQEQLGKNLFFDENLSEPRGQDCAACHAPGVGFTEIMTLSISMEQYTKAQLPGDSGTANRLLQHMRVPVLYWLLHEDHGQAVCSGMAEPPAGD